MYVLGHLGASAPEYKWQPSPRFGIVPWGRGGRRGITASKSGIADYVSSVAYRPMGLLPSTGMGTQLLALGAIAFGVLWLMKAGPFGRHGWFGRASRRKAVEPYLAYRRARSAYKATRRKNPRRRRSLGQYASDWRFCEAVACTRKGTVKMPDGAWYCRTHAAYLKRPKRKNPGGRRLRGPARVRRYYEEALPYARRRFRSLKRAQAYAAGVAWKRYRMRRRR